MRKRKRAALKSAPKRKPTKDKGGAGPAKKKAKKAKTLVEEEDVKETSAQAIRPKKAKKRKATSKTPKKANKKRGTLSRKEEDTKENLAARKKATCTAPPLAHLLLTYLAPQVNEPYAKR